MNAPALVVFSIVAAAGTAVAVNWYASKPGGGVQESGVAGEVLEGRIAGVEAKLSDLMLRIEKLSSELADRATRTKTEPVNPADIEAAVAKVLAAGVPREAGASSKVGLSKEQALAKLAEVGGRFDRIEELWPQIEAAGIEDAVLAHAKAMAEGAPNDASAQFLYGAYLIAGIESKPMAKQAALATEADAVFDRTLKADDKHWGARFLKATSLSFWPKITGKHAEALRHFEVLADQQEQGAPQPHFAETYLFLGNMHLENGDQAKARAAYERGLRWFPDHAELKKQKGAVTK